MTEAEKASVFQAGRQQLERDAASQKSQLELAEKLTKQGVTLEKQLEAVSLS